MYNLKIIQIMKKNKIIIMIDAKHKQVKHKIKHKQVKHKIYIEMNIQFITLVQI